MVSGGSQVYRGIAVAWLLLAEANPRAGYTCTPTRLLDLVGTYTGIVNRKTGTKNLHAVVKYSVHKPHQKNPIEISDRLMYGFAH